MSVPDANIHRLFFFSVITATLSRTEELFFFPRFCFACRSTVGGGWSAGETGRPPLRALIFIAGVFDVAAPLRCVVVERVKFSHQFPLANGGAARPSSAQ